MFYSDFSSAYSWLVFTYSKLGSRSGFSYSGLGLASSSSSSSSFSDFYSITILAPEQFLASFLSAFSTLTAEIFSKLKSSCIIANLKLYIKLRVFLHYWLETTIAASTSFLNFPFSNKALVGPILKAEYYSIPRDSFLVFKGLPSIN